MWLSILAAVTASAPVEAATLRICGHGVEAETGIVADGAAARPGCRTRRLAVDPRDVLWTGALPRMPHGGEAVVLVTGADGTRRAEIRSDGGGGAAALPVGTPLLDRMSSRPYGLEGRSTVATQGGSLVVDCGAGSKPAGVVLVVPSSRLPRGADVRLVATHRGDRFDLAAAPAGADAGQGSALPAARDDRRTEVAVDRRTSGAPAIQFVVQCPATRGRLVLGDLRLEPGRPAAPAARTAWAWDPARWRTAPEALVDAAIARGVNRLHVALEVDDGRVRHARALAHFVGLANVKGVAVDAVEGDPRMVRASERAPALARAHAIAAYQRQAAPPQRLAGIQYDIEPYLLPEFGADRAGTLAAWSSLLGDLAVALDMPIDAVVPFWLIDAADGRKALDAVAGRLRQLTVMAYRTDPSLVTVISEPMLAWGRTNGVPVRIALEMGPLADETEQRFVRAADGPLSLLGIDGGIVAVLAKRNAAIADAATLGTAGPAVAVRAAAQSFLGDEGRLRAAAGDLDSRLAAWPSFAGLSFHGLL
jgi:hypothetical protein